MKYRYSATENTEVFMKDKTVTSSYFDDDKDSKRYLYTNQFPSQDQKGRLLLKNFKGCLR